MRVDYLRVTHPCATLLRIASNPFLVRLACVKHAASVHSEPGSNSPIKSFLKNDPKGFDFDEKTHISLKCLLLADFQRSSDLALEKNLANIAAIAFSVKALFIFLSLVFESLLRS